MQAIALHPWLQLPYSDVPLPLWCHFLWDMREPPISVQRVAYPDMPFDQLQRELLQYATVPAVFSLHIRSEVFPEDWVIEARNPQGVAIGDVFDAIYRYLQVPLTDMEKRELSPKQQSRIAAVFDARCRASSAPNWTAAYGMLRVDWLLKQTWFGGLSVLPGGTAHDCILSFRHPRQWQVDPGQGQYVYPQHYLETS